MIKKLLSAAFIGLSIYATAQTKSLEVLPINEGTSSVAEFSNYNAKTAATNCYNLSTIASGTVTINRAAVSATPASCASATVSAGFVTGNNCFGDKEKANYYGAVYSASIAVPTCSLLVLQLYKSGTMGTQGAASSTVDVTIYSGTSASTAPGSVLGHTVVTMGSIMTMTASPSFTAAVMFPTPVSMPTSGGFYIGVTMPTGAGDTLVIYNEAGATSNYAWERQSSGAWNAMSARWGGFKGSLAITPLICGTSIVGVSESYGLGQGISLSPNPTSGIVNMIVAPAYRENLTVTVSNALGQTVINNKYDFTKESVALDLTNYNNGIYFVTVSNGKDKMVQRIVLNK